MLRCLVSPSPNKVKKRKMCIVTEEMRLEPSGSLTSLSITKYSLSHHLYLPEMWGGKKKQSKAPVSSHTTATFFKEKKKSVHHGLLKSLDFNSHINPLHTAICGMRNHIDTEQVFLAFTT